MKQARPFIFSATATAVTMVTISFFIADAFQAKSTLVSGLIAAIVIAAIPLYDINQWSLLKKSLIHFLLMAVTVLPLLLYSRWFSPLLSIGVFITCGLVGWTIGLGTNKLQKKKLSA